MLLNADTDAMTPTCSNMVQV